MNSRPVRYILNIVIGAALGVLMQKMSQLQGQWGQNFFTYMATDLGIWAVICIVIATHAHSSLDSGIQCFLCMASMVAAYYIIVPSTFMANLRWVVLAILIFPIGMVTFWYREKLWILIALELFLAGAMIIHILVIREMLSDGYQMIVHTAQGTSVFTDLTAFAFWNYVLLMVCTIFGMVYMPIKYRNEKQKRTEG